MPFNIQFLLFVEPLITLLVLIVSIVVSAAMVLRQMRLGLRVGRRSNAIAYSIYGNETMRQTRTRIEAAFGNVFDRNAPIPVAEVRAARTEDGQSALLDVMTLLAHYENMALAIYTQVASEAVAFEMIATTLLQHTMVFGDFIDERRAANPRAYLYLSELRARWQSAVDGNERVRFIEIMPSFERSASDVFREHAAQLKKLD